jgi:NADPH-dependent 2,4-dienoyl-CoA reductase/sulfur reductase-like enzyme/nitrite reductase/ring-hydroxylating ferredoxin subunit
MSGETELQGPDLAQGIPLWVLADGGQILGHTGGEAVLLVRRGEEVFAIGATCTHYGGPLAEGIVVGDTVRCPWHHACFSLRSGEAVRPPALNPVSRYRVERERDRLVVREKLDPAPAPRVPRGTEAPDPVVIVGSGAAGNAAAEELRRQGYEGRILLVGPELHLPYDRPNLSKDYLAGNAPEEWIPLHPRDFYDERRIELVQGARVTAIDPAAKTVTCDDGRALSWGALILATGADPVRLPLPGSDLPHVHYLRTLDDSRRIIDAAKTARRAVVLGASFIGLETAASLRARGVAVTVVAPDERPLGRVLGPEIGDFIRALHEEHGVVFCLGTTAQSIGPDEVRLATGATLPADLVIIGVGVQPNVALAEAAGLAIDKGVLVDEYLETSAPGIFAAGDIARWPDPRSGERLRIEHWVVAQRQGQTAARNVLGRRERFDAVPFFWSQHYDVAINYVGHASRWDAFEVEGSIPDRDACVTFRDGGRVAAVATIYRDKASLEAELAMERDDVQALEESERR